VVARGMTEANTCQKQVVPVLQAKERRNAEIMGRTQKLLARSPDE